MDPGGKGRPDLKLKRAAQLLAELGSAIEAYRSDENYRVEQTSNARENGIDFILRITTPPPLEDWGLLVGDCIHNMRAALDHLAWQLDPSPKTGPGGTTFPIYVKPPSHWPPAALARMPADAQRIIQGLQPYVAAEEFAGQNPDDHFLTLIHSLDIRDKHRVVLMTATAVHGDRIVGIPFGASIVSGIFPPFVDGSSVMQVRLPSGALQEPQLRCDVFLRVTLACWPEEPVILALEKLLSWVKGAVSELAPFARA